MGIRIQGQEWKIRQDHYPRISGIPDKTKILNTRGQDNFSYTRILSRERLGYKKESKVLET